MGVFGGDFLGFAYGNWRSEDLGIVRTIDNRYNYQVTPPIKDITAEVPNYTGVYFWGSNYDRRNITIPFAFDQITEVQLSNIKKLLNSKKILNLIFDEEPSTIYPAMVTNTSNISYVCFDIGERRIYRGEGTLNFICHTPYKRSKYKFAEEAELLRTAAKMAIVDQNAPVYGTLIVDGAQSAPSADPENPEYRFGKIYALQNTALTNLPSTSDYGAFVGDRYVLYNAGFFEMPFQIYIRLENNMTIYLSKVPNTTDEKRRELFIQITEPRNYRNFYNGQDVYIKIDTKNYTIEGCDVDYNPTGTLYNDCIVKGEFFTLSPKKNQLQLLVKRPWKDVSAAIDPTNIKDTAAEPVIHSAGEPAAKLDYEYKYI